MSDELLPCPFCGGSARAHDWDSETDTWRVECDNGNCWGAVQSHLNREEAIARWNRRATNEPQLDWDKAKAHLDFSQQAYEEIGPVGVFALSMTIMPLQDRYARGERTKWLYDEIMEVAL